MKIPIGPRNRIINFIEELKKNGTNLDFEELRTFLEKYKKLISGYKSKIISNKNNYINEENKNINEQNNCNYNNNKFICSKCSKKSPNNSIIFYKDYESEKNQNISLIDKNIIGTNYNNSIFSENNSNKLNKNLLVKYYSFNNNNKNKNNTKKKNFFLKIFSKNYIYQKMKKMII